MTVDDLRDLIRILEEHPEWRAELRRVLLSNELLQLPELVREIAELQRQHSQEMEQIRATLAEVVQIQRQHSEMLAQHSQALAQLAEAQRRTDQRLEQLAQEVRTLAEAQRRTEERVEQLAEAQRRTEERVEHLAEEVRALTEQVRALAEAHRKTEMDIEEFMAWQRGEAGRREGEQYEQQMIRRAVAYFAGGEGGSPVEFPVRSILSRWLAPIYQRQIPEPPKDPTLSDIIWWKGDNVLVVEVSQKVNGRDVHRARQRADTLREVGVNATPVVIGQEWATDGTLQTAEQEGVEWIVAGEFSPGVVQFRRLRPEATE
ncbi:MAG: hypothetical protein ACP5RN_06020 [Armatimonadota bacterium]